MIRAKILGRSLGKKRKLKFAFGASMELPPQPLTYNTAKKKRETIGRKRQAAGRLLEIRYRGYTQDHLPSCAPKVHYNS